MATTSKSGEFLELLINDRKEDAKSKMDTVEREIKRVLGSGLKLTDSVQSTLKEIKEIVALIRSGNIRSAVARAMTAEVQFGNHKVDEDIQKALNNSVEDQRYTHDSKPIRTQNDMYNSGNDSTVKTKQTNKQDPKFPLEDKSMMIRSKRASEAMRHKNPDIADLSDDNRPTKIAEKFSELYDNEWTEAFEYLSKRMKEQDIIKLLLDIVQGAYKFCKREADDQIKGMHSEFYNRLQSGKWLVDSQKSPEDPSLLIQYRYDKLASLPVERLCKEFVGTQLREILRSSGANSIMTDYGRKAVELSWWMCVRDPPVYMCPPTLERFDHNLYKPYTKSGTAPHFIVWPALQLTHGGAILAKGVVQYK